MLLDVCVGDDWWRPTEIGNNHGIQEGQTTCIRGLVNDVGGWMCGDLQRFKKHPCKQTCTNISREHSRGGRNILDLWQRWIRATR